MEVLQKANPPWAGVFRLSFDPGRHGTAWSFAGSSGSPVWDEGDLFGYLPSYLPFYTFDDVMTGENQQY